MNVEFLYNLVDSDVYVTEPLKAKAKLATSIISLMGPIVDETIREKKELLKKNEKQLKMICINIEEMKEKINILSSTYKLLKIKKALLTIIDNLISSGMIYQSTLTVEVKKILMNFNKLTNKEINMSYKKLSLAAEKNN